METNILGLGLRVQDSKSGCPNHFCLAAYITRPTKAIFKVSPRGSHDSYFKVSQQNPYNSPQIPRAMRC